MSIPKGLYASGVYSPLMLSRNFEEEYIPGGRNGPWQSLSVIVFKALRAVKSKLLQIERRSVSMGARLSHKHGLI